MQLSSTIEQLESKVYKEITNKTTALMRVDLLETQVAMLLECFATIEEELKSHKTSSSPTQIASLQHLPSYRKLVLECAAMKQQLKQQKQLENAASLNGKPLPPQLQNPKQAATITDHLGAPSQCQLPSTLLPLVNSTCNQLHQVHQLSDKLHRLLN